MEWYYADESRNQHVVSGDDLSGLVAAGAIRTDTLVWNETMIDWVPAGTALSGLFPEAPPQLSPAQRRAAMGAMEATLPGRKSATDGVAVCALVFGILGLPVCLPIFSIPAIICGHIARRRAKEERIATSNAGLALAGLITGYIGLASMILILLFYVVVIVMGVANEGAGGGEEFP